MNTFTAKSAIKSHLRGAVVSAVTAVLISSVVLLWSFAGSSAARADASRGNRSLTPPQAHYLKLARQGVLAASSEHTWWNGDYHWYNRLLTGNTRNPLATIWDVVPLFEVADDMALADPTAANLARLKHFARFAETYWDRHITPTRTDRAEVGAYAPYPHSYNDPETFFDDNVWWCLSFLDAYDATGNHRYLEDCLRAFKFINAYGWDGADGGGMWWNTYHTTRSGEVLGGAAEVAARLYRITGDESYLADAVKYITWANHHLLKWDGSYTDDLRNEIIMPHDGEGAMIAAFTALCQAPRSEPVSPDVYSGLPQNKTGYHPSFERPDNPASWCSWAEALASHTVMGVKPGANSKPMDSFVSSGGLSEGPQWDAIYVRGLLALYAYDHDARWYDVAKQSASQILAHAGERQDGFRLYLRGWQGQSKIDDAVPGMLRTHGASVSVFSALATVAPPAA